MSNLQKIDVIKLETVQEQLLELDLYKRCHLTRRHPRRNSSCYCSRRCNDVVTVANASHKLQLHGLVNHHRSPRRIRSPSCLRNSFGFRPVMLAARSKQASPTNSLSVTPSSDAAFRIASTHVAGCVVSNRAVSLTPPPPRQMEMSSRRRGGIRVCQKPRARQNAQPYRRMQPRRRRHLLKQRRKIH